MAQRFHPWTNLVARVMLPGFILFAAGGWMLVDTVGRSRFVTGQGLAPRQPVPFTHKVHVGGLGIDCRHCHAFVEVSSFAGMPPTKTCMNCHSQIWSDAPDLEPLRTSYRDDRPLEWVRVSDLPDFVYFDHSIHVAKGFGCVTCHGRVDQMPRTLNQQSLQMDWCMECHQNPERYVRPREQVFSMSWHPDQDQAAGGRTLIEQYGIRRATDCSVCHR